MTAIEKCPFLPYCSEALFTEGRVPNPPDTEPKEHIGTPIEELQSMLPVTKRQEPIDPRTIPKHCDGCVFKKSFPNNRP